MDLIHIFLLLLVLVAILYAWVIFRKAPADVSVGN